jgi:uncharacterized protein YgbK (DUF1537 family)
VTGPLVLLDDDPTGTQALREVPVFLRWEDTALLASALVGDAATADLLTNSRALAPAEAERVTRGAAEAALAAAADARLVLRGDSTLRGHQLEEYRAVRDVAFPGRDPVLMLVPALPAAGRVTRSGIHWLVQDGRRVPVSETEYATDRSFGYRSARLTEWAEERSDGHFAASDGIEVPLADVHERGGSSVAGALEDAARLGRPAACVPDAETVEDLELVAAGLLEAEARGVEVVVRCAPTFAAVLAGRLATAAIAPPRADDGLLVICGSYVSRTTRQLEHLCKSRRLEPQLVDPAALCGDGAGAEVARVTAATGRDLETRGIAVVATPRGAPAAGDLLATGARVAAGLAQIAGALPALPRTVFAKGGITSAVVLRDGLGVTRAQVAGPVAPGVALWRADSRGRPVDYVVVPGNVGAEDLLVELADLVGAAA